MICPKCKIPMNSSKCRYCGFDIDDTAVIPPVKPDFERKKNTSSQNPSRNDFFNDDSGLNYNNHSQNSPYRNHSKQQQPLAPSSGSRQTPANQSHNLSDEDEYYSKQYDELLEQEQYESSSNTKRNVIIIVSIIMVIIISLTLLVVFTSGKDDKTESSALSSLDESELNNVNSLLKKGEQYLNAGNYEDAIVIYEQIINIDPDDEDASAVYSMLFNYNKAAEALDNGDYKKADNLISKIPVDYNNYPSFADDVEYLQSKVKKYESAQRSLDEIEAFIDDEAYEEALEAIKLIDESLLSSKELSRLDDYRDEAEKKLKEQKDEEKQNPDSDKDSEKTSVTLTESTAQRLANDFCNAKVDSVNNKDFSIAANHISKSSELYESQKTKTEEDINNGITKKFEGVTVNSVTDNGNNKWTVSVTESETVYTDSGSGETVTSNKNYTVEYIDSAFYFTKCNE